MKSINEIRAYNGVLTAYFGGKYQYFSYMVDTTDAPWLKNCNTYFVGIEPKCMS